MTCKYLDPKFSLCALYPGVRCVKVPLNECKPMGIVKPVRKDAPKE